MFTLKAKDNSVKTIFIPIGFIVLLLLLTSCNGQCNPKTDYTKQKSDQSPIAPHRFSENAANTLGKNIRYIFQDKKGNYWFATDLEGLYYFDQKSLFQFTEKDGLCGNSVTDIQEDVNGYLWFNTNKGLCKFDGEKFSTYSDTLKNVSRESLAYSQTDLFFCYDGFVYRYDGTSFFKFIIHPNTYNPSSTDLDRPYGVYCILKDKSGNLWFGTDQKGVCRFDGKVFTYFTEQGLNGGAVRAIFQDKKGNIWFGNNGFGLFNFDGKTITNFTKKNGLENPDFINKKTTSNNKPNLARVWAINEDKDGNLWIGTIDNGAWKYDGKLLTNFTTKDGLTNNKISLIFKDKQDSMWFITEGEGISKLHGKTFKKLNL
ncbi:ligand-binding sensor domain-containing protein [Edaphocola aurantiacus]|uniref:ligand-binding sensor domain-containing protein n=1 Tax=Edaphocola aurantiacus TaxID=2601682 RepID=UPI001C93C59F|nr:two-component regulator propeller domain-containing protein [Edaphocola aurantiacus]